ncbi:MAG: hypothetical protein HYU51_19800 [Candidatus Rokubacteria bacterium]|nr:hypothetical protein [Candidatus Rokubacteria bacterium]
MLALTAPLMSLADPITLRYYWQRWDARQLRLLMPTTLAGIVVGTWVEAALPASGSVRASPRRSRIPEVSCSASI